MTAPLDIAMPSGDFCPLTWLGEGASAIRSLAREADHVVTEFDRALLRRNEVWASNLTSRFIPSWVDVQGVGLDQFFTRSDVAERCYASLIEVLTNEGVDTRLMPLTH